ncbi:hypothetical protein [Streptomyces hydrogenans]|uniref:hypothetical protein n=1 Tax=Streptomyces hydrogenans TaxID=1873719 RepID=UPI0035E20392
MSAPKHFMAQAAAEYVYDGTPIDRLAECFGALGMSVGPEGKVFTGPGMNTPTGGQRLPPPPT